MLLKVDLSICHLLFEFDWRLVCFISICSILDSNDLPHLFDFFIKSICSHFYRFSPWFTYVSHLLFEFLLLHQSPTIFVSHCSPPIRSSIHLYAIFSNSIVCSVTYSSFIYYSRSNYILRLHISSVSSSQSNQSSMSSGIQPLYHGG